MMGLIFVGVALAVIIVATFFKARQIDSRK
jgi:hypothetical protein